MADEQPAKPKFSIWLGDNWPGPYIVTYERDGRRGAKSVVVNGVSNISDALAVANAQFPEAEGAHTDVTISPASVAEASHFLALLESRRVEREEAKQRYAEKQQREQRGE